MHSTFSASSISSLLDRLLFLRLRSSPELYPLFTPKGTKPGTIYSAQSYNFNRRNFHQSVAPSPSSRWPSIAANCQPYCPTSTSTKGRSQFNTSRSVSPRDAPRLPTAIFSLNTSNSPTFVVANESKCTQPSTGYFKTSRYGCDG